MKQNPFDRLNVIIEEIERLDKEFPAPDDEPNPVLQPLFEEGNAIIRQLDPVFREHYRDEPEKLAEWLSIISDFPDLSAKDEAERAKDAEAAKLAAEIRAALGRINADVDQLMAMEGPDLEFEAAAERTFAGIHELDGVIRLRCRDFPEQLEKWNATMEKFADVEARFERGRELEESEPAN